MDELSLGVPEPILDRLPPEDETAAADMQEAVAGWERRLNEAIDDAENDRKAATQVLEAIDRFEERYQTYDELVPELRAWGSPRSTRWRGGRCTRTSSLNCTTTTISANTSSENGTRGWSKTASDYVICSSQPR